MSTISQLPLLDGATVEAAQLDLTRLAHAMAALKQGKMPTTDQIARMGQKALQSSVLQPNLGSRIAGKVGGGKLSGPGRELVERSRDVLQAILRLGLEKNNDDKIQRFLYCCAQASVDVEGQLETPDIPVPSSAEINEAKESLRELMSLLLTSPQLRQLLGDGVNLFRDLFADAAESVASAAIEVTKASKKAAKAGRPSEEDRQNGKTGLEGKEIPSGKDMKKAALRGVEDAKDDAEKALRNKAKTVRTWVDDEAPSDVKDAAIERFKKIVDDVQSNPEYEKAVTTLTNLIKQYASLSASAVKEAAEASSANIDANGAAESAASLFREIVESFTGPLDGVFRTADKVIKDLDGDERIKALFGEAEKLLDRAIYDPGYITSSKAQRHVESLYDRAQGIVNSNADWKKDSSALYKELNEALETASDDRALANLGRALDRLATAATKFTTRGMSLVDGRAVWSDLTSVFLPRFLSALQTIPLPRVEYTSADVDLALDNVRFTSASFIPDAAHFTTHADISTKKGYAAYATTFASSTTLSISGLRLQARDISYYINKKSGWIGLEDAGLLDIFVGSASEDADDGLDITLTVENATEDDRQTFFVLKKVEVAVQNFNIKIHHSNHPVRNWFASGSVRSYLEAQFISALEEQIGQMFAQGDHALFVLQQRAIGAGRAAPDPLSYIRALFPSGSASDVQVGETGITKVGAHGEFILAIGVEEQLLPGKTGLGLQGKDVASRKRRTVNAVESLMEEGRASIEHGRKVAQGVAEDVEDETDRLAGEVAERERDERGGGGWKSDAFDF